MEKPETIPYVLESNDAKIIIDGGTFMNESKNGVTTEQAPQWSYGLSMGTQGTQGSFTFTNSSFNGAFYYEKTDGAVVKDNTISFDKFEHYNQVKGSAGKQLDLTDNTFSTGDNDLVIIDVTAALVILPAGQLAVNYWPCSKLL